MANYFPTISGSVIETAKELKSEGLKVSNVIVFLDRNQGGKENLENNDMKVHAIVDVHTVLNILSKEGKISVEEKTKVEKFIADNDMKLKNSRPSTMKMSLEQRLEYSKNDISRKLLQIMIKKKSNLCLSLDVTSKRELLRLAEEIGPDICCLKTHMDILEDFDKELISKLTELSQKYEFLLFEDRKFADIGKTVQEQLFRGSFRIAEWADIVTVHALPGPFLLEAFNGSQCKALIVSEMSSKGSIIAGFDESLSFTFYFFRMTR